MNFWLLLLLRLLEPECCSATVAADGAASKKDTVDHLFFKLKRLLNKFILFV